MGKPNELPLFQPALPPRELGDSIGSFDRVSLSDQLVFAKKGLTPTLSCSKFRVMPIDFVGKLQELSGHNLI